MSPKTSPPTNSRGVPRKGRYAVYVGRLPAGYVPTSPADVPRELSASCPFLPATSPSFAQRLCHAFNDRQLATGIRGRRWAFVVLRSRAHMRPQPIEDLAAVELLNAHAIEAAGGAT